MSTDPRRVCLVASELYPFTAGGIGRLTYNLIHDSLRRHAPVEFHLLLPCWSELDLRTVSASFGGKVTVHRAVSLDSEEHQERWGRAYPPRWAFTDTINHADSLELMLALKDLEQQGLQFDVVEFPDYMGWAFCTLQERRLGLSFASTEVAVRLHSTDGMLRTVENQVPTRHALGTHELERLSLADADVVIAHLPGIVDDNEAFYAFEPSWRQKVKVEMPPVGDQQPSSPPDLGANSTDVAFVTKVQQFKRPDLFVRGVAAYMTEHPSYRGQALLACHVASEEVAKSIREMVPKPLAHRFRLVGPQAREELMRHAVVVIPSDFESLNLTAYETAQLGGRLVLNERCTAFGDRTPFVHGENCCKFDGSPEGLAAALDHMFTKPPRSRVSWQVQPPYWERRAEHWRPRPTELARGRVSVLITNYNLAGYLPQAIESVAAGTYENVEIVVVDDASTSPLDQRVIAELEKQAGADVSIKVVRNLVNRGLAASRNVGLRHCTGEFVLPLDADDRIAPRFLELAVRALTASPEYGVVVPTTGYFLTDKAADEREFIDFACFLGSAPTFGMIANRFSTATSLMRRSLLEEFRYDERLDSYEDWSLYLRMALSGVRFLVTNQIEFHYRRREGSMVRSIAAHRHQRLLSRIYSTLPSPLPGSVKVSSLTFQLDPEPRARPTSESGRPLHYRLVDRANAFVKRNPAIHMQLKANLQRLSTADHRPLRYELADRVSGLAQRFPRVGRLLRGP